MTITATNCAIASLSAADLTRLLPLDRTCHPLSWPETMLADELAADASLHRCVQSARDGRLITYILCRRVADELHIHRLGTDPAHRRRGFASHLLHGVISEAQSLGLRRVLLEVDASNEAAVNLYRSKGFTVDSVRKGYYQNGGDALLMSLFLKPIFNP